MVLWALWSSAQFYLGTSGFADAHKKTPSSAYPFQVYDWVDFVFLKTIWCENRSRSWVSMIGEKGDVVWDVQLEFWCIVGGEDGFMAVHVECIVRWVWVAFGDCIWAVPSGEEFCCPFVTLFVVFTLLMECGEHDVITDLVCGFHSSWRVGIVSLKKFSLSEIILGFCNVQCNVCNDIFHLSSSRMEIWR